MAGARISSVILRRALFARRRTYGAPAPRRVLCVAISARRPSILAMPPQTILSVAFDVASDVDCHPERSMTPTKWTSCAVEGPLPRYFIVGHARQIFDKQADCASSSQPSKQGRRLGDSRTQHSPPIARSVHVRESRASRPYEPSHSVPRATIIQKLSALSKISDNSSLPISLYRSIRSSLSK